MSKNVTFSLGPSVGLASRTLVITRMRKAGDDSAITPAIDTDVGAVASSVQVLADNTMWQAVLTDVKTTGETSIGDVLNFHTGSLQFPGPSSGDRLGVYAMEDLSSSSSSSASSNSSSSSSSQSTSSASSSSSSASSTSVSSSSSSSLSASSSSISTSSVSSQSASSSSSSSISASSASSSSTSSQS